MASHETRIPAGGHDASEPAPQIDTAAPEALHEPGLDQAAGDRRSPTAKRGARNEHGLTTLEWLLIVAAVAGIAALAVVLVQNVVSDVSEQVAGSNARYVAAELAGDQIEVEARRPTADQPRTVTDWAKWENHYSTKCKRLKITYGDAGVEATPNFERPSAADTDASKEFTNPMLNSGTDKFKQKADNSGPVEPATPAEPLKPLTSCAITTATRE